MPPAAPIPLAVTALLPVRVGLLTLSGLLWPACLTQWSFVAGISHFYCSRGGFMPGPHSSTPFFFSWLCSIPLCGQTQFVCSVASGQLGEAFSDHPGHRPSRPQLPNPPSPFNLLSCDPCPKTPLSICLLYCFSPPPKLWAPWGLGPLPYSVPHPQGQAWV